MMTGRKEKKPEASEDDFSKLFARETVKYPFKVIFILFVVVLLIAPTYPVEVISVRWSYAGATPSVTNSGVQPPFIVLLNRFEWRDTNSFFIGGSSSGGIINRYEAPMYPVFIYLAAIMIFGLWLLRMKKKDRHLRVDVDDAEFSIIFNGYLLLAIGLSLSIGILIYGIFEEGRLPLRDKASLWGLLLIIAPIFIILSLYVLRQKNRFDESPLTEPELSWTEEMFPITFSIGIVAILVLSFVFQASIPQEEPIPLGDLISGMTIISINNTSATTIEITFGEPWHGGSLAYYVSFMLVEGPPATGPLKTFAINYPEQVKGSSFSMICVPDDIDAVYHGQEQNYSIPVMNYGDRLVISNLIPGITYQFKVINYSTEMLIPVLGQTFFTMPGGE